MNKPKEDIYDNQIFPLMGRILAICKDHKIAMVANFALDTPGPDDDPDERVLVTSCLTTDEFDPTQQQKDIVKMLYPKPAFAMAVTETTRADGGVNIFMRSIS